VKIWPPKTLVTNWGMIKESFLYKKMILIQGKVSMFVKKKKKMHSGKFEKKYLPYKTYLP